MNTEMKTKEISIFFKEPIKVEEVGENIKVTGIPVNEDKKDMSQADLEDKIARLEKAIEDSEFFDLNNLELPEEYYYSCLPLCLLDAIYSIGVRYTSTRNVVERYCIHYGLTKYRKREDTGVPFEEIPHTIGDLVKNIENTGATDFAENIVHNSQKTSSNNGILKAKAVLRCAKVLEGAGIQTIKDFNKVMSSNGSETIEKDFKGVQGQSSGISLSYLKMLCGNETLIKPDRHILRFLSGELGYDVNAEEAQQLFHEVVNDLRKNYHSLTERALDYAIWTEMRLK